MGWSDLLGKPTRRLTSMGVSPKQHGQVLKVEPGRVCVYMSCTRYSYRTETLTKGSGVTPAQQSRRGWNLKRPNKRPPDQRNPEEERRKQDKTCT
jgi:hypothetical protein